MSLNICSLRDLQPRELAYEFRQLLADYSENTVSAQLLANIGEGSVPPSVVGVWLSVSKSPVALADALQSHSILARRYAILSIGKALRKPQWRNVWNYLGGTEGLLSIFAELSVQEVKLLAKVIGRCSKGQKDEEKQQRVTELLRSLLGSLYPDAPYKIHDERPLHSHYAKIVPACSSDFIVALLCQESSLLRGCFSVDRLLQTQHAAVRQLVLNTIFNGGEDTYDLPEYVRPLLQRMPPVQSAEPDLSASMSFSLTLLRELCNRHQDASFSSDLFLPGLVEPLMQRALRKRVDMLILREITELTVAYLQNRGDAARHLSVSQGGFVYCLVRCWSRNEELFQDELVSTISLLQHEKHKDLDKHQQILRGVPRSKRYTLLRLLVLHTESLGADISVEDELKSLHLEKWQCTLFMEMMKGQAVSLLRALIRVKPDGSFLRLDRESTILAIPCSPGADHPDPTLLLTLLERGQTGAFVRAKNAVDEQKRKASTSREQTNRAFFARSALLWAIASGSPAFYGEIVVWARRFLRDPLTNKTLYHSDATTTAEGIALLSGIPFDLFQGWSASKVRSRVMEANSVLLSFLETACQALREPSFQAYDWEAPLTLFRNVVEARLGEAPKLQQALQLSDDELYNTLWSETLNMLVQVERIALQPGHEALDFNFAKGPLCYNYYDHQMLAKPLPSSYRFIDDLAQARDNLWRELRPTFYQSATILPPPWPRGLPIQCLSGPFDVASISAQHMTPFIATRAAATVFLDSSLALSPIPTDSDIIAAIGSFVDSYTTALQIYVLQASNEEERAEREARAWAHALHDLTVERMTLEEAFRAWKAHFLQALPSFQPPVPDPDHKAEDYPKLPTDADPQENTEWNPTLHQPCRVEARPLSLTCLDWILAAMPTFNFKLSSSFANRAPHTQCFIPAGIWSLSRFGDMQKVPFSVREGLIVSALLFLDSKKGGSSRLLASPFPTELDVRYPPLFLDPEFLLRPELHESSAREVVRSLISIVPPTLLANLAENTLSVLLSTADGSPEVASLEHMTYGLLRLLSSSDRPQLASDLVLRAIIDRPDASSWHRVVLNVGLARKLPARDAQNLLSSFANSIGSKLEKQAKVVKSQDSENATGGPSSPPKSVIKVTTVKYLAQILNDADFVSPSFVVDVLSKLFSRASHLDIRVAVVESLLGMLSRSPEESSTPLAQQQLSALEAAIPLVSGMSVRRLTQQEDWVDAERTGVLPEVYDDGGMQCLPPILSQLVQWTSRESKWRQEVANRILLPVIERSRASNARWIKIFLLKHQLVLNLSELPLFPVKPQMLSEILSNCLNLLPATVLDLYQQFVLTNMAPPREIQNITNKIRDNGELRVSNEGRHWLSLYGHGTRYAERGGFNPAETLCKEWRPSSVINGIQITQIQRIVLEQAGELLKSSDHSFSKWTKFMRRLEPPLDIRHRVEDKTAWLANGKPVLERIISRIESLRTTEWQRDPQRQPAILPPTFSLRLWLLSYPNYTSVTSDKAGKCTIFAEELGALIDEIVSRGTTYHEDLQHLITAASRCPPEDKALVACHLGSLASVSSPTNTVTLLRLELAEGLYGGAKLPQDKDVRKAAQDVLASWRASEVEEIRMRGLRTTAKLQREAPGDQGWGFPNEWGFLGRSIDSK